MSGGWMAVRAIACLLSGSRGSLDNLVHQEQQRLHQRQLAQREDLSKNPLCQGPAKARPTMPTAPPRLAREHASASVQIMPRRCKMPRAGRREREPRKGGNGLDECSVRAAATG